MWLPPAQEVQDQPHPVALVAREDLRELVRLVGFAREQQRRVEVERLS
jgi:hypothetical protein